MIFKILPIQIPVFWESIKFCVVYGEEIPESYRRISLNVLLHSLLSDKSQCFVKLDDNRILLGILVTSIITSNLSEERTLNIRVLYPLKGASDSDWQTDFEFIRCFAGKTNCNKITFETLDDGAIRIGQLLGFREINRKFALELEA